MTKLGRQIIAEFSACDEKILNDEILLKKIIREATKKANHHLVKLGSKKFSPQGITIFGVLAESHISIHTYPEYGYAAVDIFTCGQHSNPTPAFQYMKEALRAGKVKIVELERGF
ncbi:MAG: adenosylmethionine decarboxylase [bacterium]